MRGFMRAVASRTVAVHTVGGLGRRAWLGLVAGAVLVLQLAACSMAGRTLAPRYPSADPAVRAREQKVLQHPLDLMPPVPSRTERDGDQSPAEQNGNVQVSPDGSRIAFEADRDGVHGVWMARRDGDGARRVSGSRFAVRPAWSPDGERLAFLARPAKRDDWAVFVADADGDGPARRLPSTGASLAGIAWFPDSRHICYGSDAWLIVVDTSAAATRAFRLPSESGRIVGVPAVSPDGRSVVFAVAGDGAWIVSVRDGAMTQLVSERDVDAFAWAPGGRQVAFRTARDGQWRVQIVKDER